MRRLLQVTLAVVLRPRLLLMAWAALLPSPRRKSLRETGGAGSDSLPLSAAELVGVPS